MGNDSRFLVVISVLEGRGFPKRPKHKLIVEAKFDGELLTTDPVAHSEAPDFNQELAWELDRKALQQHRLQRSTIKIQCYACDTETTMKESVGYVVLDLRSVGQNKQVGKWHQLLHSKYSKTKAELRLALYLDEDPQSQQAASAPLVHAEPLTNQGQVDLKSLIPVLNEADGYYQIGPVKTCSELFVLSVTIAYASNLPQLIPSSVPLSSSTGGFFFYYSLLGNDVTNEPFFDLVSPNFPAERASVKIRSSVEALRSFFSHQPGLQIHLCCGDQSLGSCNIPLGALLKSDSTQIYMRPVTIEGSFHLTQVSHTQQQAPALPSNNQPCVGVSIVLRKEDLAVKSPTRDNKQAALVTEAPPAVETQACSPEPDMKPKNKSRQKKQEVITLHGDATGGGSKEGLLDRPEHRPEPTVPDVQGDVTPPPQKQPPRPSSPQQQPHEHQAVVTNLLDNHLRVPENVGFPPQAHHFTFSIDLRSIRDNHSTNTINIFLRYVYPFFGSAAPILTHPPVEIRKGSEVLLPQSFCAFDFACSMHQLQETFARVPLVVEVWHRDRQLSQNTLIGSAKLTLSLVTCADRTRIMNSSGVPGWRQEASDRVPVVSADGKLDKCAEISLVLSLEDWGPIATAQSSQQNSGASGNQVAPFQTASSSGGEGAGASSSPRSSAEYQAAVELELWKENQEKEFERQMKQKEATYMKALADEWKKRDTEREILTQKKLTEYKQMEDQLRTTLIDLERREKKLAISEHEVMKLRSDLQREHDRKLQEMKEASRRLQEDCDHQVQLQKMKFKELEEITNRYKQELQDSERKYKALEKEFATSKENQSRTPEVRLQSEINLLTVEKFELDRKLDAATKSKIHYKQQWGRALKEVARLKQKEQEVAKAHLLREKQELEQMKLRFLAAEEKEVVSKENRELEAIKSEINKLKQIEEERLRNMSDSNQIPVIKDAHGKPLNMDLDASVDEHVVRLVEERDTLLRTGVYTTQDKIIAELDRQIREAINQRSG
ncbi:hypothetical protein BsWGS_00079 [Bradybaena similaris]